MLYHVGRFVILRAQGALWAKRLLQCSTASSLSQSDRIPLRIHHVSLEASEFSHLSS